LIIKIYCFNGENNSMIFGLNTGLTISLLCLVFLLSGRNDLIVVCNSGLHYKRTWNNKRLIYGSKLKEFMILKLKSVNLCKAWCNILYVSTCLVFIYIYSNNILFYIHKCKIIGTFWNSRLVRNKNVFKYQV